MYQVLTITDTEYFYTKCKKKTAGDQIDSLFPRLNTLKHLYTRNQTL